LIADSIPESSSGKAFGIHRAIDQSGAIAGPIAAFALLQVMDSRGIFVVSLIPSAIAVIILIFLVKEVAIKRALSSGTTITTKILSNFSNVLKGNRPFTLLIIISGIFSLGAFNYSFILLKASDLGISKGVIPLVYAVINVSHTAIGIPTGILADRIGKEKVLTIGYAAFVISSSLMIIFTGRGGGGAATNNFPYAYMLAAVFGIYIGISETLQRAVIPRYVSSELRGTAYGMYNVVVGSGFFVSNIVFGYLWDSFSVTIAVFYSMVFAFAAIIGMFAFIKKYPITN
jgi:MFS family permease